MPVPPGAGPVDDLRVGLGVLSVRSHEGDRLACPYREVDGLQRDPLGELL
ncbi:hypothetical protein AB0M94_07280 [Streptomyces xanthochromogenes]